MTMTADKALEHAEKTLDSAQPVAPENRKPPAELMRPDGSPTPAGWKKIGERFRQELPFKKRQGRGGMQYSYIDARQVQDVLDGVVGPGNWESRVKVIRAEHPVAVRVGIGVFGVWKYDVGYSNNPEADDESERGFETEPLKAATSDAFKRAAVQHGIGRFLYSL